jgi:DHA2 family multidrug resistance protein
VLLTVGLVIASLAFFGYSHLNAAAGPRDFLTPQVIQGVGMALVFVPLTTIAMDPIPLQSIGYATSIYSLMRNIGSSVGISFVTTMLARRAQFHQERLTEAVTAFSSQTSGALGQVGTMLQSGGVPAPATPTATLGVIYRELLQQANLMAFVDLFYVLGIMFLVAVPVVWFMRRPQGRRSVDVH